MNKQYIDPRSIIDFLYIESQEYHVPQEPYNFFFGRPDIVAPWWRGKKKLPAFGTVYDLITRQAKYQISNN